MTETGSIRRVLAFMGGTFDPIHNGHLRTALEIRQFLNIDELRLIPCDVPTHRDEPGCTSAQRFAMLQLAVADEPGLVADDRELASSEASYTIHTLRALRDEIGPEASLVMVVGMDSYLTLPDWYQWREILGLGHILVVQRPGWSFDPKEAVADWTEAHRASSPAELKHAPHGRILLHSLTPLGISATQIRDLVRHQQSPRYLLPDRVWRYIQQQGLYGYDTKNES